MLIDTHCHLDAAEFDGDRDAVVLAAQQAGVSGIIVPSVNAGNFSAVRDCSRRYRGCFPAYGIHPLYLDRAQEGDLLILKERIFRERVGPYPPVAVGEIGLDFYVPGHDAARQEHFFVEQLKIARDLDLPVLLHARRAVDQVLKCLRRAGVKGGIAHAFNGSMQQAREFGRLGFKLGFGGAMTFAGSTRIRRIASDLPLEAIVLETDAPDIPPVWMSGRRNTPSELLPIAQVLADLRGVSLQEVMRATSTNARQVIGMLTG